MLSLDSIKKSVTWQPTTEFIVYKVKYGDTLSVIAKLYYGDSSKWTIIHNANKATVPNAKVTHAGQELKLLT